MSERTDALRALLVASEERIRRVRRHGVGALLPPLEAPTAPPERVEAQARVRAYLDALDGFYGADAPDDVLDYADGGARSPSLLLSDLRLLVGMDHPPEGDR